MLFGLPVTTYLSLSLTDTHNTHTHSLSLLLSLSLFLAVSLGQSQIVSELNPWTPGKRLGMRFCKAFWN